MVLLADHDGIAIEVMTRFGSEPTTTHIHVDLTTN
jgi:hypothetical protein